MQRPDGPPSDSQQPQSNQNTAGKAKMKNHTDRWQPRISKLKTLPNSSPPEGRSNGDSSAEPSLPVTYHRNDDLLSTGPLHLPDYTRPGSAPISTRRIKRTPILRLRTGCNKPTSNNPTNNTRSRLRAVYEYLRLLHLYEYITQHNKLTTVEGSENYLSMGETNEETSVPYNTHIEDQNATRDPASKISPEIKNSESGTNPSLLNKSEHFQAINTSPSENPNLHSAKFKHFQSQHNFRTGQNRDFIENVPGSCLASTLADDNFCDNVHLHVRSNATPTPENSVNTNSVGTNTRKFITTPNTWKRSYRNNRYFSRKCKVNKVIRHRKIKLRLCFRDQNSAKASLLNCTSIRKRCSLSGTNQGTSCSFQNIFARTNGIIKNQNWKSIVQDALVNKHFLLVATTRNALKLRTILRSGLFKKLLLRIHLKEKHYRRRGKEIENGYSTLHGIIKYRKLRKL